MLKSISDYFQNMLDRQKLPLEKWVRLLITLSILASSTLVTMASNSYKISLSVYVYDCSSNRPISGAYVITPTAENRSNSQGYTDAGGYAHVYIKPGDQNHTIRVSAKGYYTKDYSQYFQSNSSPSIRICLEPQGPLPIEVTPSAEAPSCSLPKPDNDEIEYAIGIEEGLATGSDIYSIESTYGLEDDQPYMKTDLTSLIDLSVATTNQNDPLLTPSGLSESQYYHTVWYKVDNKDNTLNSIYVNASITLPYGDIQSGIICFYYSSNDSTPFDNVDCQIGEAILPKEAASSSKAIYIEIASETPLDSCSMADISIQAKYKKEEQIICPYSSPASNDMAGDAMQINREQWQDKVSIETAGIEVDDMSIIVRSGLSALDMGQGYHTVWYRYTPKACPPSKTADIQIVADLLDENGAKLPLDTAICVTEDRKTSLSCGYDQISVMDVKAGQEYYIQVASVDEKLPSCTGLNFEFSQTCQARSTGGSEIMTCLEGLRKDIKTPCELMITSGYTTLIANFMAAYQDCNNKNCQQQEITKFIKEFYDYLAKTIWECFLDQVIEAIIGKTPQDLLILKELYDWIEEVGRYIDKNPECWLLSDIKKVIVSKFDQKGVPIYYFAVHSPASLVLTDAQGRRAGFLDDGTIVIEIPTARVYEEQDIKVIFFASFDPIKNQLKGTNEGTFTLDVINPKDQIVQEMSFVDVPVTSKSVGEVDLSVATPVLKIDRNGDGNVETFQADAYNEYPVVREANADVGQVNASVPVTSSVGGRGIGLVVVLLVVAVGGVFVYTLARNRDHKKPATRASNISFPYRLVILSGALTGQVIPLTPRGIAIGRASSCDLRLPEASVSRQHARLRYDQGLWFIQDQDSRGGTYLNGKHINAARLQRGDRITIGSTTMTFE